MSQLERVYGVHAVEALLRHPPKRVKQLWLAAGRQDPRVQVLVDLARSAFEEGYLSGGVRSELRTDGQSARIAKATITETACVQNGGRDKSCRFISNKVAS